MNTMSAKSAVVQQTSVSNRRLHTVQLLVGVPRRLGTTKAASSRKHTGKLMKFENASGLYRKKTADLVIRNSQTQLSRLYRSEILALRHRIVRDRRAEGHSKLARDDDVPTTIMSVPISFSR